MGTLASVVASGTAKKTARIENTIPAAEAKAHLLRLLDEVARERKTITITKRGSIVAKLIPVEDTPKLSAFDQICGRSKGKMKITGDIVSPDWDDWGPEWR